MIRSVYNNVSRVLTMKGLRTFTDFLEALSARASIRRILGDKRSQFFAHFCFRLRLRARAAFYIVLPHPSLHGGSKSPSSGCGGQMVKNIRSLASSVWGADFGMLTIDPKGGGIVRFGRNHKIDLPVLFQRKEVIFLANPSFLLLPEHLLQELLSAAQRHTMAIRAKHFGRSLYAIAIDRSMVKHPLLNQALSCLIAYEEMVPEMIWSQHEDVKVVHGDGFGAHELSPAVEGASCLNSKRSSVSPFYLNKALFEVLYFPVDTAEIKGSPERMRQALLAHRDRSAVPWIFNVLTNQIEYRMGKVVTDSFPPEVHLSVTGRCNLECRFCSYSDHISKKEHVGMAQMGCLDFLDHLQTVRLSSGLGEPTINPHLGAIIEYLATKFPHIDINFSTNGVALNGNGLVNQLINKVSYINVSLNAATPSTWKELCRRDLFDRVCSNLRDLQRAKRKAGAVLPLVYGSMVLTTKNIRELPDMPGLCRSLGVDRFTGIPFLSFKYNQSEKYGRAEAFHQCQGEYEVIYRRTLQEARRHRVSIEIPVPQGRKRVDFGLEAREFYDFAGIEEPPPRLDPLVDGLRYAAPGRKSCPEIWKIAYITNIHVDSLNQSATHYLYPCLGPLSMVDFSMKTPFGFPDRDDFLKLWNSPLHKGLRKAQSVLGVSTVCDVCRKMDSRDPANFGRLKDILDEWNNQWGTESPDDFALQKGL